MDHDLRADTEHLDSDLPKIDAHRIADVLRSDESALAHAVRRVVDSLGDSGYYAAHGSSPAP